MGDIVRLQGLLRHHRQTHRGGLHPRGRRGRAEVYGAHLRRLRAAPRGHSPKCLRLRTLHRGLGCPLRGRGPAATVVPISGGNTDRQIMILRDFAVTALCCTPSYFVHLIERARELGIDLKALPRESRCVRRRALVGRHAHPHRGQRRGACLRHLRTLEDHRPLGRPQRLAEAADCTSSRTISTPRLSTPRPATPYPTGKRAEWR